MKSLGKYIRIYFEDRGVRDNVNALFSIIFNVLYIVFNLVFGIIYKSAWFIAISAYYSAAALLRCTVVLPGQKENKRELYECGIMIALLSVPMSGIIFYTVISGREITYPPVLLVWLAVYTLFRTFYYVSKLFSKEEGEYSRLFDRIRFATTNLSIFNLQIALLSFFGIYGTVSVFLNSVTGSVAVISTLSAARKAIVGATEETSQEIL